jgi:hypothetical protein
VVRCLVGGPPKVVAGTKTVNASAIATIRLITASFQHGRWLTAEN